MTTVTLTGHLAWDAEPGEGPPGQRWLILGLVIEASSRRSHDSDFEPGDWVDVSCSGELAEEVIGLPAGTTVEIDADHPRQRTWTTRNGEQRNGVRYRGLGVRVIEPPSMDGIVRNILAMKSVEEVLKPESPRRQAH